MSINPFKNQRYFDGEVSHGFVSLYTGRTIIMIGSGFLGLFLPIFIYNLFNQNFQYVILYYGLASLIYIITIAFGAQLLNKFGFRRALRASVFIGALFYAIFYFIDRENMVYLIPLSIIILTLFRILYWIPYHTDFAKFTDKKNRGREISVLYATATTIGVLIPVIAGFIINKFSFDVLFIIAMILFLVSGIPYLTIPRTNEKYSWSYIETWKNYWMLTRKKVILAHIGNGAESFVGIVVWPIFIFQILDGNYLQVGAISTFIIGVSVVIQLTVGKYVDKKIKKEEMLHWGSILYATGWIVKIFIDTAFQIFVAGLYHSIANVVMRTPFDTITYEIAADEGHYVDEFTVIKEIAINIGKILMAIVVAVISFFFNMQWVFLFAALASLLFSFVSKHDVELDPKRLQQHLSK